MMGYAYLPQTDTGLHMRQRARAAIIAESANSSNRIVFLNIDAAMGDSGIRRGILAALQQKFPGVYNENNVAVVGTHQHSGVGGYLENLLPQLTSLGFVNTVLNANINRSPSAYLNNPAEERARYEFDQDKTLSLLRFDDTFGKARGFLGFFAVHGTSIYENNTLVSGDNKGMAAYLAESAAEPSSLPGQTEFVALFSQGSQTSSVGDTSPNTLGAFCESPGQPWDGQPCTFNTSTCGGTAQDCHGRGPGFRVSDFYSNYLIGLAQFEGAQTVMNGQRIPVSGSVRSVHQIFICGRDDVSRLSSPPLNAFLNYAVTVQEPSTLFKERILQRHIKGAVTPSPSAAQVACQFPKPILLNTGFADTPYLWSPSAVHIQMLRVGQFVILVVPGEFTTMSGRRIREAIRAKLIADGVLDNSAYVVIAGPANTYGHYVTTIEEYAIQRYEGASTLFGPHTLEGYIDIYSKLTGFIADNASGSPPSAPAPPDLTKKAMSLQSPVIFDAAPFGKGFGQVLSDVQSQPYSVNQTVSVQFVGANPRNNLRLEGTFLTVEQFVNNEWVVVRTDSHPSTTYQWLKTSTIMGTSAVTLNWTIEAGTSSGSYRIQYFGDSKPLIGSISSFTGTSGVFTIA
ncbi:hypothetical protein Clacol_006244 [Clathrus columnatus]|uniref:Neutral ceramidase n=1 Tax=Clathrus columnatus TaxID=1419009 RepID=A0AAV5AHP5_9AGAM|nr:hypothetical protein Clacol_006244 [Clathrus columnatus]